MSADCGNEEIEGDVLSIDEGEYHLVEYYSSDEGSVTTVVERNKEEIVEVINENNEEKGKVLEKSRKL